MGGSIRESGLTITWTVSEYTLGKMVDPTVESIRMTRSMVMASTHGLMVVLTLVTGVEESNMVLEPIVCHLSQRKVVFGKKGNVLNGSMKINRTK